MESKIWQKCINCTVNCCKQVISKKIFLTAEEKNRLPLMNKSFPCKYLNKCGKCAVHKKRPADCRLFPFDIVKKSKKYYWKYWLTNCPITKEKKIDLEEYLLDLEKNIIPNFLDYIEEYSKYRRDEFERVYGKPVVLRAVRI